MEYILDVFHPRRDHVFTWVFERSGRARERAMAKTKPYGGITRQVEGVKQELWAVRAWFYS
jgi:hypothetical protein